MDSQAQKEVLHRIKEHSTLGATLREKFFEKKAENIANIALHLSVKIAKGNKLLFCGNGGSAADCQHLAAEFTNRFLLDRPPLPAIALTTDTSAITAIGNDFDFNQIFSKQVMALGLKGDVLIGISTSGNSANVNYALEVARSQGLMTLGLTGKDGGTMPSLCDTCIVVESGSTALIQEIHITVGHLLCNLIDYYLFENVLSITPFIEGKQNLPNLL